MIGVCTSASAYQHVAGRLRDELAQARAAQRRGEPRAHGQVEAVLRALAELKTDARECGIRI